jgi:putative ABC transport system ATP-binding protein
VECPLIDVRGLAKDYPMGHGTVEALRAVDLSVERGEYLAVMGASGSGKSTLLHLLGCLDRPSGGRYLLDGREVAALPDRQLARLRNEHIGFVFQTFNLVPELDIRENVAMPFLYGSLAAREASARASRAIGRVGLAHRERHRPAELSGGEMQRVAIARALAIDPLLILADEPTGNLDRGTSGEILDLFTELNAEGATVIVVTHDVDVAARAGFMVTMTDGVLHPGTA